VTALAFDGRYFAIDSQVTQGDTRYSARKAFDITNVNGDRIVAFGTGTVADIQAACDALREDERLPKGDYTLLVWGFEEGVIEYNGDSKGAVVSYEHYAAGSGAQACLGAMKMGASAAVAVAVACEVDTNSGLPVVVFDTKTGKFKSMSRRRKKSL